MTNEKPGCSDCETLGPDLSVCTEKCTHPMTDTTLAQQLRGQECCQSQGGVGCHPTRFGAECPRNVADALDAQTSTITSLQERVKALTELTKQFDRYVMSGEMDAFDRATAAEAKLVKVEAEKDRLKADAGELVVAQYATTAAEARIADLEELIAAQHGDVVSRTAKLLYDKDDKIAGLSAELAEARKVGLAVLASWDERMGGEVEVLKTMVGSNRQYWSPGASMVHSSVIADLRSFLSSSKEDGHD